MASEKSKEFHTGGNNEHGTLQTDVVPVVGLVVPSEEGAVEVTEENPLQVGIGAINNIAPVPLQASALGALEVANSEARRLVELQFIQQQNSALSALQTRGRERITFIDRRGNDGSRGR